MRRALIIGCKGQDGTYPSELLERKVYEVIGVDIDFAFSSVAGKLDPIDIQNYLQVCRCLASYEPDEIYYLAAFHHSSENLPSDDYSLILKSIKINTLSLLNCLEGIRKFSPRSRLFYAGSSHVFGDPEQPMQDETTPLSPNCPYGISKTTGIHLCRYYREQRGLFCSVGILYNHESPRRSSHFVSRKIVQAAIDIKMEKKERLIIGDLAATIDWGYSPDYTLAMHQILNLDKPNDFVIATGKLHTIQEFIEAVFSCLGLDWRGFVVEDPQIINKKPHKNPLCGNSEKLRRITGWQPSVSLAEMAEVMVKAEYQHAQP